MPFCTHEFMGLRGQLVRHTTGSAGSPSGTPSCTPSRRMGAIVAMICHGVFERFPRLRVAYLEAGCGWLPSWLHRIDEHLEMAGKEFPELTMNASDYFRRNCWITTECDDPYVSDVIRWMGDDRILFESDFPHPDSKYPHTSETFLGLLPDQISDESKRKILWDNPIDVLPLPRRLHPEGYDGGAVGCRSPSTAHLVVIWPRSWRHSRATMRPCGRVQQGGQTPSWMVAHGKTDTVAAAPCLALSHASVSSQVRNRTRRPVPPPSGTGSGRRTPGRRSRRRRRVTVPPSADPGRTGRGSRTLRWRRRRPPPCRPIGRSGAARCL